MVKPKQVGEQHKMLFSPEYNFKPKTIRKKKKEEEDRLAKKEVEQWEKGMGHDEGGV